MMGESFGVSVFVSLFFIWLAIILLLFTPATLDAFQSLIKGEPMKSLRNDQNQVKRYEKTDYGGKREDSGDGLIVW